MIAGLVVMFGGAQRANDATVVEAEQFIVRDKDGNERVRVGVGSNGAAHLVLQNKDRKGGIDLAPQRLGSRQVGSGGLVECRGTRPAEVPDPA